MLLRGLPELFSGEALPEVEGVLGWGWAAVTLLGPCGGSFPAGLF